MSSPIAPIGGVATAPLGVEGTAGATPAGGTDLAAAFTQALHDARGLEQSASQAAEKFASGDPSMGIHEVMIASEKANISLRYATTLKNKALEAYRELMNTQV